MVQKVGLFNMNISVSVSFSLRFDVLGFESTGEEIKFVLRFVEGCLCNHPPLEGV